MHPDRLLSAHALVTVPLACAASAIVWGDPGEPREMQRALSTMTDAKLPTDDEAWFEPSPNVAADVVEGEAIVIRLDDGMYFSMNPIGSQVWQLLEAGLSVAAMADVVSRNCSVVADVAARDLRVFLDRLLELRLVQACGCRESGAPPRLEPIRYSTPAVEGYEDMADLLALDPPAPGRTLKSVPPK